jgi:hypothetical protein
LAAGLRIGPPPFLRTGRCGTENSILNEVRQPMQTSPVIERVPFPSEALSARQAYGAYARHSPKSVHANLKLAPLDNHSLSVIWAKAWLREYRCNTHYLALLVSDGVDDLDLRSAWLAWWDATCACREALYDLEGSVSL